MAVPGDGMEFTSRDGAMPRESVVNTPTLCIVFASQGRVPIPITIAKQWSINKEGKAFDRHD
jgi:hypothetical protein